MKALIFICVAVAIFLATPSTAETPRPKHFLTDDACQFWEMKDEDDVVEHIWYLRSDKGVQIKQGFTLDSHNTFYQSYNYIDGTRTQINQYSKDIILCSTEKLTKEEKDATVILSHKWQKMKEHVEFIESKDDDNKWKYDGVTFLGANHTNVKYVERDGEPHKLKFFNADGKSVKESTVIQFETSCELVEQEFKDDVSECEKSEQAGNSFGDETRKRGANSVRVPSHQFDSTNPRFAAQMERSNKSDSDRCTKEGAKQALQRAIETRSMEYGNWCGVGSEKGTCCQTVCPDGGYDVLCRKHDSSTYFVSWVGVTISPCACDAEFVQSSKDFDGCVGDENAPWRVDPDPTGAVTCEKTKEAAINTFHCMPCVNFDCKSKRINYPSWESITDCEWVSYWAKSPENPACDGPCWDESMKPWAYRAWYDTPKC